MGFFTDNLAVNDPTLAWDWFFGPVTPYQYRLEGPGAWDGAREAIVTKWERVWYPTTRMENNDTVTCDYLYHCIVLFTVAIILMCYLW